MNPVFNEKIGNLKVVNNENLENVVYSVHYHIVCDYLGESLPNEFDVQLDAPTVDNFTDFNSLTKQQVLNWVHDSIGIEAHEERKNAMQTMIEQIVAAKEEKPKEVAPPWLA